MTQCTQQSYTYFTMNNEDKIIHQLITLDERVERIEHNMPRRQDIDALLKGQDSMVKLLTRVDHEQTAIKEALRRHENEIEEIKLRVKTT